MKAVEGIASQTQNTVACCGEMDRRSCRGRGRRPFRLDGDVPMRAYAPIDGGRWRQSSPTKCSRFRPGAKCGGHLTPASGVPADGTRGKESAPCIGPPIDPGKLSRSASEDWKRLLGVTEPDSRRTAGRPTRDQAPRPSEATLARGGERGPLMRSLALVDASESGTVGRVNESCAVRFTMCSTAVGVAEPIVMTNEGS